MKLHSLPKHKKKTQRIGRSGKRGTTSGRGTKGQKSRSGNRRRPAERDLILHIPKKRGYRNKPKTDTVRIFNLDELAAKFKLHAKAGAPLDLTTEFLKVAGLVEKNFKGRIKILGDGEVTIPVNVQGLTVSASAKAKIEKAGGKIVDGK